MGPNKQRSASSHPGFMLEKRRDPAFRGWEAGESEGRLQAGMRWVRTNNGARRVIRASCWRKGEIRHSGVGRLVSLREGCKQGCDGSEQTTERVESSGLHVGEKARSGIQGLGGW